MCGIAVIIAQKNITVRRDEIENMTRLVAHRGPDGEGFFMEKNIAFGHRRLAILDLQQRGSQPMHCIDENYTIVHNGEIYNYLEIRELLTTQHYQFETETDTEVIVAAYDCWGERCVERFNGMWAFVIYDKKKQLIFASRDRFGVKPMYYFESNEKIYLVSELKQLTASADWQPKINKSVVADFLEKGLKNHTEETFFENVFSIPAAHNFIYSLDNQRFEIKKYYQLPAPVKKKTPSNFQNTKTQFLELLSDAVRLRLRSDVAVGTTLSGGLDSTSITALAAELLPHRPPTVSACFPKEKNDESKFVAFVTDYLHLENKPVYPTFQQTMDDLPKVVWQQDEPIGSASVVAQYQVFREANRNKIPVMLDGQGADEILFGYNSFYKIYFKNLFLKNSLKSLLAVTNLFRFDAGFAQLIFGKKTIFPDFLVQKSTYKIQKVKNMSEMSQKMLQTNPLPSLLHYADRNSMAASIESRLPFMDFRLVEFCFEIPDDYKIYFGKRKYILREAMKSKIPKEIYLRYDKLAFATPQDDWMRQNAAFFRQKLVRVGEENADFVNSQALLVAFDAFLGNSKISSDVFWRVLTFGIWRKIFFGQT